MIVGMDERKPIPIGAVVAFVVATGALLVGWREFWFLTDDAFISFRYVSNSILGHGYVWNPPPFRPVEGYSNFLWVVLLDVVWRVFGAAPPVAANWLSLFFSFLTLVAVTIMTLRIKWRDGLFRFRSVVLGMVLAGVVLNRTFLAWSSSGLETAMFNFYLIAWVSCCLLLPVVTAKWTLTLAVSATLISLTRPDGMLFVLATGFLFISTYGGRRRMPRAADLAAMLPLLLVPAHLVWRYSTYGEWLPNTYYAKVTKPWIESGVRYLASFILEYGLWMWLAMLVVALVMRRAAIMQACRAANRREQFVRRLPVTVVLLTLCAHVLFYVIAVGGDHFEYRVLSHLVPLLFVSFAWLLSAAHLKHRPALACMAIFVVVSYPVQWTHWAASRDFDTREQTYKMRVPIAAFWPAPLRWYASAFDNMQYWLIGHFVCVRHQEHKVFVEYQAREHPDRAQGMQLSSDGFPVHCCYAAGYPAWVMPRVNVIDYWGLNDYVIARNRDDIGVDRFMAHERKPPAGYVAAFRPNVKLIAGGRAVVIARQHPLTADEIRDIEQKWASASRK
jgi:arabinofuranosyltransferase